MVALLVFAGRLIGSVCLGYVSLWKEKPTAQLLRLEREGRVLSWASLVVTTSALFSALIGSLAWYHSPWAWIDTFALVQNTPSFLARFVPLVVAGLLLIFLTQLLAQALDWSSRDPGVRLVAATAFALSLAALLVGSATVGVLKTLDSAWSQKSSEFARILAMTWGIQLVGLACAIAAARLAADLWSRWHLSTTIPAVGAGTRRQRMVAIVPYATWLALFAWVGFQAPTNLMAASVTEMLRVSGAIDRAIELNELSDRVTALERAELIAYPPVCEIDESQAEPMFSCTLVAQSSGTGVVLLDGTELALTFNGIAPNTSDIQDRRQLRKSGAIPKLYQSHDKSSYSVVLPLEQLKLLGGSKDEPFIRLELGKPLAARLSIPVKEVCRNSSVTPFFRKWPDPKYTYMYLIVRPYRLYKVSEGGHLNQLGPWSIPSEFHAKVCPLLSQPTSETWSLYSKAPPPPRSPGPIEHLGKGP